MTDWISKKDLLAATNISYGQLYRWKRERLIPDSWFEKRASFTGQETYLPREQALERIQFIVQNKDRCSLAMLQERLAPKAETRMYSLSRLAMLPGVAGAAAALRAFLGAQSVNHGLALTVLVAARAELPPADTLRLIQCLIAWQDSEAIWSETDACIAILQTEQTRLPLLIRPAGTILLPENATLCFSITMDQISRQIIPILNQIYEEASSHE